MTIVEIEKDSDGELVLPFSEETIEELGWTTGDTLQWIDNNDGTFSLKKYEDSNS